MDSAGVKMSEGKTEFLQLGSRQNVSKCEVESIDMNGCDIKSAQR